MEGSSKSFFFYTLFCKRYSKYFYVFRLNGSSGFIIDNPQNYSKDLRCAWFLDGWEAAGLIVNGNTSTGFTGTLTLTIDSFATECGWDHLYIYDGDSVYSKQLAALRFAYLVVFFQEIHILV